jgi:hypothetical protein
MSENTPPTIKQRLAIFKKAQEILTKNEIGTSGQFICLAVEKAQEKLKHVTVVFYGSGYKSAITKWSLGSSFEDKTNCMKANFPELHRRKPSGRELGCAWWKVMDDNSVNPTRLRVVGEIIKELEVQLDKS